MRNEFNSLLFRNLFQIASIKCRWLGGTPANSLNRLHGDATQRLRPLPAVGGSRDLLPLIEAIYYSGEIPRTERMVTKVDPHYTKLMATRTNHSIRSSEEVTLRGITL